MTFLLAVLVPTLVVSVLVLVCLLIYAASIIYKQPNRDEDSTEEVASNIRGAADDPEGGKVAPPRRGQAASVTSRHSLQWQDIIFEVGGGRGITPKAILRGCSGVAHPGELLALVGPSGAGKSTLLDILAMRLRPSSGTILVGGELQGPSFRTFSSYVPQETSLVPTLSVWETLSMHASLRIPHGLTKAERNETITSILASMGLSKVKHSRVGGILPGGLEVRGLSGGEARRLHIGCGVVAAPSIIFLDEPTSGLDSHAALVLMEHLQVLAAGQRTILCSIHQPRQAIWDMFHKVEILSEGYLMFFGPPPLAITWFCDGMGYPYSVEEAGLPADWLLDLVSIGFQSTLHHSGFGTLDQLSKASDAFVAQSVDLPKMEKPLWDNLIGGHERRLEEKTFPRYPTSFWNQLRVMMWRAVVTYMRNPADVAGRIVMSLFIGIIVGLVFFKVARDRMSAVQMMIAIFFTLLTSALQPFAQMSLYVADRQFYIVDVMANLYSPAAYYLAQAVTSIPFTVFTGQVLLLINYGFLGWNPSAKAILLSMACQALATLTSIQGVVVACYLMPNQDMAMLLATTNLTFSIILAGFLVRVTDLIPILQWFSYLTPLRYAYQILAILQFPDKPGQHFLRYSGVRMSLGLNFGLLVAVYLAYHVAGYAALVMLKHRRGVRK